MMVRFVLLPFALFVLLGALVALVADAEDEWMFEPKFREGRPGDVLHAGPPPLLRSEIDAFVDLFESAFSVALDRQTEQSIRDDIERAYAAAEEEAPRSAFSALVAPLAGIRQKGAQGDLSAIRRGTMTFRRELDARLGAEPDVAWHRRVNDALERGRETAWPGSPPVSRAAADTWLELVEFVVSVCRNDDYEPTPGQREGLRTTLAAPFHGEPAKTRERLRDIHRTWLRVKAKWDTSDVNARLALRWRLVRLQAKTLPPEKRVELADTGDLAGYAVAARALAAAVTSFDAWANLARNPAVVLEAIDEWLGPIESSKDHTLLYR